MSVRKTGQVVSKSGKLDGVWTAHDTRDAGVYRNKFSVNNMLKIGSGKSWIIWYDACNQGIDE